MLRILLEGSSYNKPPVKLNEYAQFTIKLDDVDVHFQVVASYSNTSRGTGWMLPETEWRIQGQQIHRLTIKTKEEKAAEESVKKAKEALLATENALKAVKDKK